MARLLPGFLRWKPNMSVHPNPIRGLHCLPANVPSTLGILYVECIGGKRLLKSNMSMENKFSVSLTCDFQTMKTPINKKPTANPKWNAKTAFRIFSKC